ncbi:MAG: RNA pseudouridine synthase [Bacteroidaceae bacterium]|nr:RNA pseudouridine synthase [Bacteroidaceae bacterium]
MQLLHRFREDISAVEPPTRFNNPFYYSPHPLCVAAACEVRAFLLGDEAVAAEAAKGKMFGVLVVRDPAGEPGYFAAFSGLLAGSNNVPGFVPPVFDFLSPTGYFKREEAGISLLNEKIRNTEQGGEYRVAAMAVESLRTEMEQELAAMREAMRAGKRERDALRAGGNLAASEEAQLVRESQFQKAELRRATQRWQQRIEECRERLVPLQAGIAAMKEERKRRSAALQEWLFTNFKVLNARGDSKDLLSIFKEHRGVLPPAGSGECAAPKLLQYAYKHGCTPVVMAEFWVGNSPQGEVRRDGCFYGSCKSKCEPILSFMLQGLDVEENALEHGGNITSLRVLYEDDYLIAVDKPSGVLSVPGIVGGTSVQQWLRDTMNSNDIHVVHRLDMATSGVLVAAKSMEMYKAMQSMFATRKVRKEYIALLEGVPALPCGTISLPLWPDYENRPRQRVDFQGGKEAVTNYCVVETRLLNGKECALVQFEPLTGRTHQLRVHAACKEGLDCPIVGDALYGNAGDRLMLHASSLSFSHPATGEELFIEAVFR